VVETVWGPRHFTRRRGEALRPEREPPAMLEQIRRVPGFIPGIGEYNFAGRIVQSWDTANKATELSDFSVCTSWGIKTSICSTYCAGAWNTRN
jgi:hypothetical protein